VCTQVGQPGSVGDISFAAGDVLGLVGIDQHHRDVCFQQVVERPPVVAGRLHHHHRDVGGKQVLTEAEDLVGH